MGDQWNFGKASDRTLDAAIAREWDSGLVLTAAILSCSYPLWVNSGLLQRSKKASLFDHLVGAGEQRSWNVDAKRLSRLQVDDELELGRQLDRNFGRFFPLRMRPTQTPVWRNWSARLDP